jgi:uncharacterized membrane protein
VSAVATFVLHLVRPWASVYSDSKFVATVVTFAHLAGLLMAGGVAVAFDRTTLRFSSGSVDERRVHLDELNVVHRIVIAGLLLVIVSGILMLAADLAALVASWAFWVKMALVALLLANGVTMTRSERALRRAPDGDWARLRRGAMVSLVIWFAVLLASVALARYA